MKICSKCRELKEKCNFAKSSARFDGLDVYCKACTKAWREANKEALLSKKKEYYQNNIQLMRDRNRNKYLKHKDKQMSQMRKYYSTPENWAKRMIMRSKERAFKVGLEFNITVSDLFIPDVCPYLGIPLTYQLGKGQLPSNASIDRIDSSKGYVKGNVQIISRRANTMKNDASNEELVTFAMNVLKLEGTTLEKYVEQFRKVM